MSIDPFLIRVILAGVGVAVAAGPLGCFMLWRRMAFWGDTVAHAALLGVVLALLLELPILFGVLVCALIISVCVVYLGNNGLSNDTLLGVSSHGTLALGLLALSLLPAVRVDLISYLFGDILAVGTHDLLVIWGGAALILILLYWRWQRLLTATLHPDLAQASGIDPRWEALILNITLAIVVAVALKIIGVLLIAAMLIIPAAAARPFARTPEAMALMAALIGVGSVIIGIYVSAIWDTPTGPSLVGTATVFFVLSRLKRG